jgi:hypothetical protein
MSILYNTKQPLAFKEEIDKGAQILEPLPIQ